MPDFFYLIGKWWKQMLALVILALVIVSVIVFLQPAKYLSTATALPANPGSTDKASVFNGNIQEIYSALGSADDVDRIVGTGQLDTIYLAVTDQFNLFDHYHVTEKGEEARFRAATLLKKNSRIMKSEYGELRVKVWDTDKHLAPQLANAMMQELEIIHQNLQNETNRSVLNGLLAGKKKLEKSLDSIGNFLKNADITAAAATSCNIRQAAITDQLTQYEKLIGQYQLMVDSNPSVLRIVERARAPYFPDQPKPLLTIGVTGLLSIFFAIGLALILERRKRPAA